MKKKILILISILIILAIGIIIYFHLNRKDNSLIKTFGNIEIRQVDLSFQVSGIIEDVFVEEGDYVKKGQILAKLIDKDYVANYEKAQFQEEANKAQAQEDEDKYKRNIALCKDGTNSKQECDTLLNKKNLSKATYKQSQANSKFQKNQLEYTTMKAPQNGIITTRVQEKGARVNANQIVYVLSLNEPIWVRTYIKETDLGNIKYGQKARILTDTTDIQTNKKKEYSGYIGYISPVAEFTPKTVQTQDLRADLVYRIRIYIDNVDNFLRQGMPVSIEIPLNKDENELH
ncbi:MAG: efflux RND transporter periplasmic adaptor subunit [Candidatus Gastranaerophilales bacterium]|nr:efflux RND transporter periplasmic adaptor subunit [Candidatus Gastranaerophilales bacterium]